MHQDGHRDSCPPHNHPEGIKGAVATALAIYYLKNGKDKDFIRENILNKYYPEEIDNCSFYSEAHFTANQGEYLPIPAGQMAASNGHYTQNVGAW